MEAVGDCYMVAGNAVLEWPALDAVLVHAEIISGEQLGHIIIGHAWIEVGDVVFDSSNGKNVVSRKEKYYAVAKPQKITRYSGKQAAELMLETGHYGPWIKKPDGRYMSEKEVDKYFAKINRDLKK